MFEVTINRARRTITLRATGEMTLDEVTKAYEEAVWATDTFKKQPHVVLADMRGLAPLAPDATMVLGEIIKYGRTHGTVACVHLSDASIARLQASRLAREASPHDRVTVDVVSLEEAEKVLEEKQRDLRAGR